MRLQLARCQPRHGVGLSLKVGHLQRGVVADEQIEPVGLAQAAVALLDVEHRSTRVAGTPAFRYPVVTPKGIFAI